MLTPILETKILFRKLLSAIKPEIVLDIGSCDGTEAVKIAQILPESKVVAFEANPTNFRLIKSNSDIQKYNVKVHNLAVQNIDDEVSFHIIDSEVVNNRGSSSLLNKPNFPSEIIKASGIRLDSFVKANFKSPVSLALWIDVEGAGYQVLEGIDSVKDQIAFFQIEVEENQIWEGQRTKNDIVSLAKSLNFTEIARGEGDTQYDMIFFNENKVGDFYLQKILKRTVFLCRFRKIFASLRNLKRKYLFNSNKRNQH
jgi:FkbM family methyltransferase